MKKIKTLLFFLVVGLFLFVGINSNANISPNLNVIAFDMGGSSELTLFDGSETIAHKTSIYSKAFKCNYDFDYAEVYIEEIKGGEKVYVVLQENVGGVWVPKQGDPGSEILVNTNLKNNIYLMYCGFDSTNYVTPKNSTSSKVFSVSTNSTSRYGILAHHEYRIMVYNCYNLWGKSCSLNATLKVKDV